MIDFTGLPKKNKYYAGANGKKLSVVLNNEQYMLKFPPLANRNKDMSYTNGCFSEYIGCQIFKTIGIPVQDTLLGTYSINGREKVVVACKDFTCPGVVLQDFASMKNQIINSEQNGYGTELEDIINTIETQTSMDIKELTERFWDMFIVDALIGNWDRHNGNWGFLYNTHTDEISLAPVYDCGGCMYPQADEKIMEKVLTDKSELEFRLYEIPLSAIMVNNKKINYYDFISSLEYPECNNALKRILPVIDIKKIEEIIDNTVYLSELQKNFYKTMLKERKERILDFSLNLLMTKEKTAHQFNEMVQDLKGKEDRIQNKGKSI